MRESLHAEDDTGARGTNENAVRVGEGRGSHTATHVDAPKHFFDDGTTIDALPLDLFMGPAMLVAMSNDVMAVTEADLRPFRVGRDSLAPLAELPLPIEIPRPEDAPPKKPGGPQSW